MLSPLCTEIKKLRGTLVLAVCAAVPSVLCVIVFLLCIKQKPALWIDVIKNASSFWGMFLLPLTVAMLSALLAQVEHANRMWDHLLALPVARWKFFVAKATVLMALLALSTLIFTLELRLVALLLDRLVPTRAPIGHFPWALLGHNLFMMWLLSLMLGMVQLWIALSQRSFVTPVIVGISGTFIGLVAGGASEAILFPWALPSMAIIQNGQRLADALLISVFGACITLVMMLLHLNIKEL
jgi:lantibiotic transport system permease protein